MLMLRYENMVCPNIRKNGLTAKIQNTAQEYTITPKLNDSSYNMKKNQGGHYRDVWSNIYLDPKTNFAVLKPSFKLCVNICYNMSPCLLQ